MSSSTFCWMSTCCIVFRFHRVADTMDITEEVPGGYQSKTQSLRDKMKKRRQAIESLLTGEAVPGPGLTPVTADTALLPVKRNKSDTNLTAAASDNTAVELECDHNTSSISVPDTVDTPTPEKEKEKTPSKPADDLSALLSLQSAKEREERSQQDEIFSLLRWVFCFWLVNGLMFVMFKYCLIYALLSASPQHVSRVYWTHLSLLTEAG